MSSQNVTRCNDLWVADLMIMRHGLKEIKDPVHLRKKALFRETSACYRSQRAIGWFTDTSVAREQNCVAPTPQRVSTTALKDAAPVKPPAKPTDVIELMDSDDRQFLVKALECQVGTANNASPSRDDGAYGSGAVGGDDDDDVRKGMIRLF